MQFTTSLNFGPSLKKDGVFEPMSVLDTRSPSPSTSASTLSTSNSGGAPPPAAAAAAGGDVLKEEWAVELQGLCSQGSEKYSLVGEDWDSILSGSAVEIQDQSLMKWDFSDDFQGGGDGGDGVDVFHGSEIAGSKVVADVSPNNGVHQSQNPIYFLSGYTVDAIAAGNISTHSARGCTIRFRLLLWIFWCNLHLQAFIRRTNVLFDRTRRTNSE